MKKYTIVAGVNGSGKTTLYQTEQIQKSVYRINADEILVEMGGHGVSETDIERRYEQSFSNLKKVLPICNLVALYDNTEEFRRIAIYKDGVLVRKSHKVPDWFEKIQ
ncbi:MAG: hypothetical protein E7302_13860 [Butyrivibrio sp.]|nr:hypothetical protein [Butyrivibrio sp.]